MGTMCECPEIEMNLAKIMRLWPSGKAVFNIYMLRESPGLVIPIHFSIKEDEVWS